MFKRIFAIVLTVAMLVTTAFAAAPADFTDFPTGWSAEAMEHAVANGLLEGYNNKIEPNGKLTRAQMAAIMSRAFGATASASLDKYQDVDADAWYYTELSRAVQMGAMEGYDNTMRPNDPITRQEAFLVLFRLFCVNSDGTQSALDQFNDGSRTASWAKEGMAAMVKAGYVHGDDQNRLNPNSNITRAEFAKVMDNLVSVYVDAGTAMNASVNGNVVVRADGKTLKDLTIHGDLILADNVSAADLTNVTIEGRLVIRGGSKALNLNNVQAVEMVINNPNDITKLTASGCELGKVHLRSDVMVSGKLDNVLEEGGHVIEDDSTNPKPDPEVKPEEVKLVEQAQLVDMGWSEFVAVQFAEGKRLENCTLTVDGVTINDAVTPVTDNDSIVKWEISELGHAELVVSDGTNTQTISLGNGEGKAPVVETDTAPDYFLVNGPVYVWDYHLTNYDDAGNIRVEPAKTTFNVDAASGATDIAYHSPDTIIYEDPSTFGKVTGTVELMFNYANGTEAEKAFVDGITDVDLVSFQEYKQTLNDELTYTLDKGFVHGDHTVACIKVPVGQTNFTTNGRYRLRVTSNGTARLFPIHLVNEVVPSLTVTGDTGHTGKEVHFRVDHMTYGITCPVYRVELTNPNGETFELAKFDDWFLNGDLLVLYNDHTNYFPVDGTYTVKVWADGFQPFEKTFYQTAFASEAPLAAPLTAFAAAPVDAISTASVGGGSSSGDGEGGGDSNVMNANLILNTDLLVNAEIVKAMGFDNKAALGIAERWETMRPLYVFNSGAETVYTYDEYYDAVNSAKTQGQHLSFAEYIASEAAVITTNRPYAVKYVLEDNLLGETFNFGEAVGKPAPALTLTAQTEKSVTFTCEDQDYLTKLAEAELFLNSNYPALSADQYVVDAEAGTLTLNTVKTGKNTLTIHVPGYKTAEVIFEIEKTLEEVNLTAGDITKGEPVVITCNAEHDICDFLANITSVKLIAPNGAERVVRPDGSESTFNEIGYIVAENALTIGKNIFNESFAQNEDGTFIIGEYKAVMTAERYGEKTVTFQVAEVQNPVEPSEAQDAPNPVDVKKQFYTGDYQISFGMGNDAYMEAISTVTVNGEQTEHKVNNITDGLITIPAAAMQRDAENTVVISANGYKDLTLTIAVDANGVPSLNSTAPMEPEKTLAPAVTGITHKTQLIGGNYYIVAFEGSEEEAAAYVAAIDHITANGEDVQCVASFFNDTMSYKTANDSANGGAYQYLHFTEDCFSGEKTIVISAQGYEDLTFQIVDGVLAQ